MGDGDEHRALDAADETRELAAPEVAAAVDAADDARRELGRTNGRGSDDGPPALPSPGGEASPGDEAVSAETAVRAGPTSAQAEPIPVAAPSGATADGLDEAAAARMRARRRRRSTPLARLLAQSEET